MILMQPYKYNSNNHSGLYRHRINIQKPIIIEDSLGQEVTTWEDTQHLWAMIKTIQGREYIAAATTQTEKTTRFIVRYTTGINESMRIVHKDKMYEIVSVINDDEMNKTLTIIGKG
jgi:SPP1 family predicted phage head-tail adaptor